VRQGAIGTFTKDKWPEKHGAVKDAVFGLKVNGISDVVEAPYGYTFARRCLVEKVHTAHILIRYTGAKNAGDDIDRTREQAQSLAMEMYGSAKAGGDFATLAQEKSEDASSERGGDLGTVGRGLFVPPYETAAFALKAGGISAPVETKYGFHVIKRVE
jgi:parvulin-like peptidyl-prolyl isomerase